MHFHASLQFHASLHFHVFIFHFVFHVSLPLYVETGRSTEKGARWSVCEYAHGSYIFICMYMYSGQRVRIHEEETIFQQPLFIIVAARRDIDSNHHHHHHYNDQHQRSQVPGRGICEGMIATDTTVCDYSGDRCTSDQRRFVFHRSFQQ
jgi:hypothetical protein